MAKIFRIKKDAKTGKTISRKFVNEIENVNVSNYLKKTAFNFRKKKYRVIEYYGKNRIFKYDICPIDKIIIEPNFTHPNTSIAFVAVK